MSWTPTIVGGSDELPSAKRPSPSASVETSYYGYRRRKARNPLRLHVDHVREAVTEANKLEHDPDDIELIRRGAESARLLADTLARAAGGALSPKEAAASEAVPASDGNEVHAQAFRDLEGDVCDLERMGHIARELMMECSAREDGLRPLELATFAVWQLAKMTQEFRESYYKRYHGETQGAS